MKEVLVHVRRGDEFLVLRRTDHGYWHTVAGGVEPGEEWAEAARRELREETGLEAEPAPLGAFEYVREDWESEPGLRVAVQAFFVVAPAGWEPRLDHEHSEHRWCTAAAAAELLFWPEPAALLAGLTR
jgi:8-oxo-dGTP pyrophosphatase MutT (NUDIX family)